MACTTRRTNMGWMVEYTMLLPVCILMATVSPLTRSLTESFSRIRSSLAGRVSLASRRACRAEPKYTLLDIGDQGILSEDLAMRLYIILGGNRVTGWMDRTTQHPFLG